MEILKSFIDSIQQYWAVLVTIITALFYYSRLRNQETLKLRLQLITDCYFSFTALTSAIQKWSSPVVFEGEEPDKDFAEVYIEYYPQALDSYRRAVLLMNQNTVNLLNDFFVKISQMLENYENMIGYREENKINREVGLPSEYSKEIINCYDKSKREIPSEIWALQKKIKIDFTIMMNGFWKTFWSNIFSRISMPIKRNLLSITLKEK